MKASKSSSQPHLAPQHIAEVVLDVEVDLGRVHFVLANCGDAAATDVVVEFSRPLAAVDGGLPVSELPVFRRLGVLRPGQTLRIFWNSASALLGGRDAAEPFVASVAWSERARGRQRETYRHDLSIYRHWPACVEPDRGG
jgi:hypothetical protein